MNIHDPLYGPFRIDRRLTALLSTPEVRRLSQIRLLNTLSPSLAVLGEVRRYSHTLGVLHLAHLLHLPNYSEQERLALSASVLLHDIGTPAFGHLFEYLLRERHEWHHERIIHSILWGTHHPTNRAHQIFAGSLIGFQKALARVRIPRDIVEAIVTREHPLSELLFGTIDLDNLDNVVRMAWCLGLTADKSIAEDLASNLCVTRAGQLTLGQDRRAIVENWSALRRSVYEVLVFDPWTVAAQAVLSEAMEIALDQRILTQADWYFADEEMIDLLRQSRPTKSLIAREYLGTLPRLAFCVQSRGQLADAGFSSRQEAKKEIEAALSIAFKDARPLGYVFVDKGTFSKELSFHDPTRNVPWKYGDTSHSIVFYGFVRLRHDLNGARCGQAADHFACVVTARGGQVVRVDRGGGENESESSGKFGFATS